MGKLIVRMRPDEVSEPVTMRNVPHLRSHERKHAGGELVQMSGRTKFAESEMMFKFCFWTSRVSPVEQLSSNVWLPSPFVFGFGAISVRP